MRRQIGSVVGTGAEIEIKKGLIDFKPRVIRLFNVTGLVTAEFVEPMPDASALKRVTAGDLTYITTLGITPFFQGFKIGADTDINVAGEVIHWVCEE